MPDPINPDLNAPTSEPPTTTGDPGYSRDKDLERARGLSRPASADLDPFERDADERPERPIHVSPDPDDPNPADPS